MPKLFTYFRLPLLAVLTSFALTSCFDHEKKCDPRPAKCGTTTTPATPAAPTTPTGGSK